ncbi:MAG: hypothetical protein Q7J98_00985, partial [Kiritimatiellia bacterium]|nr:hypothetical protein [Kiritimatiellia bacterium]
GADYSDLADDGIGWVDPLQALGMAVTWDTQNASVLAITGQTIRAYSDQQIKDMLGKGLLCDLSAATAIFDRGLGKHLGVNIKETGPLPRGNEEFIYNDFGENCSRYRPIALPCPNAGDAFGYIEPAQTARVVSRLTNTEHSPLLTLFENELGGRVAVQAYNLSLNAYKMNCYHQAWLNTFLHPYRRLHLRAVLEWLNRGPLPLSVEVSNYTLPICAEEDGYTRITVFNISLDVWNETKLLLNARGRTAERVEFLSIDGRWKKIPRSQWRERNDGCVYIEHQGKISFQHPGTWCIFWQP